MTRYDLLMAGQAVRGIDTSGEPFWVAMDKTSGIKHYTVYQGGRPARYPRRTMLQSADVREWMDTLDREEMRP